MTRHHVIVVQSVEPEHRLALAALSEGYCPWSKTRLDDCGEGWLYCFPCIAWWRVTNGHPWLMTGELRPARPYAVLGLPPRGAKELSR